MTYLILAVLCSTINHLIFKALPRFKVNLPSVIAVNYVICIIIGYSASGVSLSQNFVFNRDWFPISMVQGALFVVCFILIGRTTAKHGVVAAGLATRLSVAIPTVAAFFLYGDPVTPIKTIGILTALGALYLSCTPGAENADKSLFIGGLPVSLFLFFGAHATLLKFVQARFLEKDSYHAYVMTAFCSALLGSVLLLGRGLVKKTDTFKWKELGFGVLLGCINYGAIYFLVRALGVPGRWSSQLFPTISISVVILSSAAAWAFFKERLGKRILAALGIGVAAIILINFP